MADWIEVVVPVGAADVDDIAALIATEIPAAAAGTEQRGDEVVFWAPAGDAEAVLAETRAIIGRWHAAGSAVDPAKVRIASAMPEAEWRDAWKRYFKVSHLTRQFVVVPSWERYEATATEVVIDLDPGMAFGTGTHASTRLVLEEIQELADHGTAPTRVLDVGCGSGILAIATVKRWPAASCLAIDNDPLALAATRDNAAVNQVSERIQTRGEGLAPLAEPFPLVLANIQAHVLRELREDLIRLTATSGTLILSGLLTPQAEPLADEFVAAGMQCIRVRPSSHDPQWSVVTLRR
ncbi:MAG: 50S ribosomal protein L11 methyltransferase [Kofleriaceae bacterium]